MSAMTWEMMQRLRVSLVEATCLGGCPLPAALHGALADDEVEHRGALLEDRLALEFLAEPLDRHVQLVEGEGQHARQKDGPHDQQREDVVEDEPATVHASTRTHTYIDHPSSASVV